MIASTSSQFRDPKVIWYEDHWVMVLAYAQEFAIGFFTSPNLKEWTATSNFSYHGLLGLQYECPNLVEMPVKGTDETMWVLQISINPGAPLGGSIAEYFPGSFNGTHFEAVDGVARIADFGKVYSRFLKGNNHPLITARIITRVNSSTALLLARTQSQSRGPPIGNTPNSPQPGPSKAGALPCLFLAATTLPISHGLAGIWSVSHTI